MTARGRFYWPAVIYATGIPSKSRSAGRATVSFSSLFYKSILEVKGLILATEPADVYNFAFDLSVHESAVRRLRRHDFTANFLQR